MMVAGRCGKALMVIQYQRLEMIVFSHFKTLLFKHDTPFKIFLLGEMTVSSNNLSLHHPNDLDAHEY
ncbi:MAG: hypothetical protein ACLTZB_07995 [Streptococcus salivarius]